MKWYLDLYSCLDTTDMGHKLEELFPLFGEGELGPHLMQYGRVHGLPPCQVSSSSIEPFSHNTPTLQTGQRSDSVGQTVLEMVYLRTKWHLSSSSRLVTRNTGRKLRPVPL